jgi:hypothetical protein
LPWPTGGLWDDEAGGYQGNRLEKRLLSGIARKRETNDMERQNPLLDE